MAGDPSEAVKKFFGDYILQQKDVVLTIKSASGASVNIDGPFDFSVFPWPEWRPKARTSEGKPVPQETVVQPTYAPRRKSAESSVHLHVPWERVRWVRLHAIQLPLIDHERRISFYATEPPTSERGDELFFFYARAGHKLDAHPELGPIKYGAGGDRWGKALQLP
jgi:hypothetical protein